jgi:hypothetical protein
MGGSFVSMEVAKGAKRAKEEAEKRAKEEASLIHGEEGEGGEEAKKEAQRREEEAKSTLKAERAARKLAAPGMSKTKGVTCQRPALGNTW